MNENFKNTFTTLIAVVILMVVAGGCGSFGGLFKSETANSSTSENSGKSIKNDEKSENSSSGGIEKSIVGTWEAESGAKVKLTFSAGGDLTKDNGEEARTAKYKDIDEETIEIQPPGQNPIKTKVKINGDTMTIDDRGKTLSLKKVSS